MINECGWRGKPTCGNYRAQRERRHHIEHYRGRKSSPTTCRAGRSTGCVTIREIRQYCQINCKVRVCRICRSIVPAVVYSGIYGLRSDGGAAILAQASSTVGEPPHTTPLRLFAFSHTATIPQQIPIVTHYRSAGYAPVGTDWARIASAVDRIS